MNNYFRLLFISSVLFILLALFDRSSGESIAQGSGFGDIEHVDVHPGILPCQPENPSSHSGSTNTVERHFDLAGNRKFQENLFSGSIRKQLSSIELRYADCKPEIICKTGQFLHLANGNEDPSHL